MFKGFNYSNSGKFFTNTQKAYRGLKRRSYRLHCRLLNNAELLNSGRTSDGNLLSKTNRARIERSTLAMSVGKKRIDRSISALSKVLYHDQAYNARLGRNGSFNRAVIKDRNMRNYHAYLNSFKK